MIAEDSAGRADACQILGFLEVAIVDNFAADTTPATGLVTGLVTTPTARWPTPLKKPMKPTAWGLGFRV